jgi:hypothetical protein
MCIFAEIVQTVVEYLNDHFHLTVPLPMVLVPSATPVVGGPWCMPSMRFIGCYRFLCTKCGGFRLSKASWMVSWHVQNWVPAVDPIPTCV